MRILYHHRTASKDGQAVHIEEMIEALRALGHEVRVVAPGTLGRQESAEMGQDMAWVHRLKAALPKALYELMECAYSLLAYRRLLQAAAEFQPDALYERYNLFLLAGVWAAKRLGVPFLLEVNAPLVHERSRHSGGLALAGLASWAERKVWRSADAVLPVTQVLASFVANAGVAKTAITVIPNGINRAHFARAPSSESAKVRLGLQGRLVLGFTGFVREWHGVDRIVDWMAAASAARDTHLLVVGDGPVRGELAAQAQRLGLDGRVTFTGVVDRHVVPDYVAAFDIALQPAVVAYASPLKLMEYLVLGKAIVAPHAPNLEEILTHGVNAWMFDQQEVNGLEDALTKLCLDRGLRERLSAGAADTIDRLDLTWLGNARKVISIAQHLRTDRGLSSM